MRIYTHFFISIISYSDVIKLHSPVEAFFTCLLLSFKAGALFPHFVRKINCPHYTL